MGPIWLRLNLLFSLSRKRSWAVGLFDRLVLRVETRRPRPAAAAAAAESSMMKRSAAAMEEGRERDWASLLPDILNLVAARLLAVDVVDYISFEGVCARWRASAPSPRDPTLRDPRLRHFHFVNCTDGGYRPCQFALFEVDTVERRELMPVSNLGDQAVFLSPDRCLSVSQSNLPSIASNTIYFDSEDLYPVVMYSVSSGTSEMLSKFSIIHNYTKRIQPSVRPFTLADQLFTFCNHRCWSRGLMFHEYHCLPRSWKALFKKLKDQDHEVQVPS